MSFSNRLRFLEEFHITELSKSLSIKNGSVQEIINNSFCNHAVRSISNNGELGFFVSSGEYKREFSIQEAISNQLLKTNIPSQNNQFVRDLSVIQDITNEMKIEDIKEILLNPENKINSFNYLLKVKERTIHKNIVNNFGCNGTSSICRLDFSVELRDKKTSSLILKSEINSSQINEFLSLIKVLSLVPLIKNHKFNNDMFILSPNIVSDFIYPIQSLLLNRTIVTDVINKHITITEEPKGLYHIPFDDEGIKTSKKTIYQNGVLKPNIFTNLNNEFSTGNGFRKDYRRKPNISPLIWKINPGEKTLSQLISNMNDTIWIDNMVQGRIDEQSGYYIANVITSYLISNGEIKGILPPFTIVADPISIFEDTNLVLSKERKYTDKDSFKLPFFITDQITVMN